ncbi:hypothetical protein [Taibaiella soli]|uniref:Uncharacterized protein n=1 Tax=Taibaiella soli TaxID=1649169 RepID=A0A2W2BU86_9BACT|nr:hypothetical protein [Taibaiella soli]PZF71383.1 hypothetical protein DN068_19015 [Taibaiella soli]
MRKLSILLLALCSLAVSTTHAQVSKVEVSTPFDEPEDGWNKVLQLKNGNTFFFHFTNKDGIEVTVYNKQRNLVATRELTSELWEPKKMKHSVIEGLYEIGGQPVIFLQQQIDRTPSLFRIKLDANTGEIAGEKLISTLDRYPTGASWAMKYGRVEEEDFFVEKDPRSDCYAVVNFNSFAESNKRLEIMHYDGSEGKHKIINRAFYNSPEGQFKYLRYIGMTVDGPYNVFMCTYGFNHKNDMGNDSRVIMSRLKTENGSPVFTHNLLAFSEDFRETRGIMQYNKGTNMLQLMTLTYLKSKGGGFSPFNTSERKSYYLTLMSFIDPESLTIAYTKPIVGEKIDADLHQQFEHTSAFHGLPQQMIINRDNTTTVLMEEMETTTVTNNVGSVVSQTTTLGNIGVAELNEKGSEDDGHVILKVQSCKGIYDPLYLSEKSKGKWSYRGNGATFNNNAFLSFDYLNTDNNKYVLFNDYPSNYAREQDGKRRRKTVTTISGANTMCYKMQNGKISRFFVFGTPQDDDQTKFCYVESSHFSKETNTYATLMMEKNGRDKQARIAWVTFQ